MHFTHTFGRPPPPTDLPYDGFDDFVQSLREVPYDHLVQKLLETRTRLQTAVEKGTISRRNLGRRPQEVKRWTINRIFAVGIFLTSFMICTWVCSIQYGTRIHETPVLTVFPRRLKTFVGREDVFKRIDACLEQNRTCLIKGLGGVGKTSLAIEYGHRRAERYPGGVFWVRLASKRDLCASISQYCVYVSGPEKGPMHCSGDLSCESVKFHFRMHLTNSEHWILVADEAVRETMKDLESLLPHTITSSMHVLLTSNEYQRLDMERIAVVSLSPFSDTEAQALFSKTVRPSSKEDTKEIKSLSRSIGHHPLALQFAFAYIEGTGCSVKEYHDKYVGGNATEKGDH
uniref:NB-ARC domain-containing protein n=1 Tax=Branchiostoma floridae TaxID=7739 RepID=C3Y7F1_BRAFL|eukprot:XP_002607769.1 hypothetical protein BRAFLDRAFT_82782 [Branchiostoma floridae]